MKGIVFVELVRMAEEILGEEAVDEVLDGCALASGGAYNAVGSYPCSELMILVEAFGIRAGASVHDLQYRFGRWMLDRFVRTYPGFFVDKPDVLSMLEAIEGEVHVEVRKLYPDAELPHFDTERTGDGALRMTYRSPRALTAFCHGLIDACIEHFEQRATVEVETGAPAGEADAQGARAVFTVRLAA